MNKMKALVKAKPEKGIWLQEVDIPTISENDVLIKIKKTAICGTDLHIYLWDKWSQETIKTPMTIGHEYVGEVVEIGENVTNVRLGDIVTGEGHIVCGECYYCRTGKQHLCGNTIGIGVNTNGAFAEYLKLPATNVWHTSPSVDEILYSVFDPFGNAVHTTMTYDVFGKDVLVSGAGPIGIMAGMVAKHLRAKNIIITDINPYRIELAKKVGLTAINVISDDITSILEQNNINKFDVGLEMSGSPQAFTFLIDNMKTGGEISLLAVQSPDVKVDWNKIVFGSLKLTGIYGRKMYETWHQMQQLLDTGLDLSPIITHTMKVDDFQKGFDLMEQGKCGKVILEWD